MNTLEIAQEIKSHINATDELKPAFPDLQLEYEIKHSEYIGPYVVKKPTKEIYVIDDIKTLVEVVSQACVDNFGAQHYNDELKMNVIKKQ